MDYKLLGTILLSVLLLVYGVLLYLKATKNGKFDVNAFLEDFVEEIAEVIDKVIAINKMDPSKFSTVDEFKDSIILIVVREFKKDIEEFGMISPKLMAIIPDEAIIDIIRRIIDTYEDSVFMKKEEVKAEEVANTDNIAIEVETIAGAEQPEGKSSTIGAVQDFYKE